MKALAVATGFVPASYQVAADECLVVVIERILRAVPRIARQPAGKNQKGDAGNYGCVRPLAVAVAAFAIPSPTHPSFMLMPVSSK